MKLFLSLPLIFICTAAAADTVVPTRTMPEAI